MAWRSRNPNRVAGVRECYADCDVSTARLHGRRHSPEWQATYNACTRRCTSAPSQSRRATSRSVAEPEDFFNPIYKGAWHMSPVYSQKKYSGTRRARKTKPRAPKRKTLKSKNTTKRRY